MEEKFEYFKRELKDLPKNAALAEYFDWLYRQMNEKSEFFLKQYQPILDEEEKDTSLRPYFSVIIRTQGKRPEPLREALLSLVGQEEKDFEVILIGHKLNENQDKLVGDILGDLPADFRKKIRFFHLNEGGRTTPLNFGFAHARGEYALILDDDDIVFDHWLSQFREAAKEHAGKLLHSYVLAQKWMMISESDEEVCRAVAAPTAEYCVDFDLFEQLRLNRCPLMGIAFPLFLFRKMGFCFDERLNTTEDWDYIMRNAFVAGVHDLKSPSAIYRLWTNAENSQTLHLEDEWKKNLELIQGKFEKMPLLVPPQSRRYLKQEAVKDYWLKFNGYTRVPKLESASLYYDVGEGYNEDCTVHERVLFDGRKYDVCFPYPSNQKNPYSIRFDLTEEAVFSLENSVCIVNYENGEQKFLLQNESEHNGIGQGKAVFFPYEDPWLRWELHANLLDHPIKSIRIVGEISCRMTPEILQTFQKAGDALIKADAPIPAYKKTVFWKLLKKARNFLRRLFK